MEILIILLLAAILLTLSETARALISPLVEPLAFVAGAILYLAWVAIVICAALLLLFLAVSVLG